VWGVRPSVGVDGSGLSLGLITVCVLRPWVRVDGDGLPLEVPGLLVVPPLVDGL
jgi:hypothetical protein